MALRINDNVVRGEIDNRTKGMVLGKVWFHGETTPLELELTGHTHPDLTGCFFEFVNPDPTEPLRSDVKFPPVDRGSAGDITASRKVRRFLIPLDEALDMLRAGGSPPEKLANGIYLEWYSNRYGRVVMELADCQTTISAPAWQPTEADKTQGPEDALKNWFGYLSGFDQQVEEHGQRIKPDGEPWTEHDFELFFRQCDTRTDKLSELIEKFRDQPDASDKIAEAMGWHRMPIDGNFDDWIQQQREQDSYLASNADDDDDETDIPLYDVDDDDDDDEDAEDSEKQFTGIFPGYPIEDYDIYAEGDDPPEFNLDPAGEGIHWVRVEEADDHLEHPVQNRARICLEAIWDHADRLSQLPGFETNDVFEDFLGEFQTTTVKLSGALYPVIFQLKSQQGPFVVAYLKRALDHLHKAQGHLQLLTEEAELPADLLKYANDEVMGIRQGLLDLMQEQRKFPDILH